MKHSLLLLSTISLCIAASTSIAMELETTSNNNNNEKKSNIIAEITCIKKPLYAQYLYNGNLVIAGEDGCSIINPKTNAEIKKISTLNNQRLTTHLNQKLFALLSNGNQVSIYDMEKNNFIWEKRVEGSCKCSKNPYDGVKQICFNPHDSTIFLVRALFSHYKECHRDQCGQYTNAYRTTEYNYTINQEGIINFKHDYNVETPFITLSPTQKEIYVVHPSWVTVHPTDVAFSEDNHSIFDSYGHYIKKLCQYNPNGSYIVQVDYHNNMYIIDSQDPTKHNYCQHVQGEYQNENFKNIQFYSNSVLAIVSAVSTFSQETDYTKRRTIGSYTLLSYFDIHTKKYIHVSQPLGTSKTHDLSFSPGNTSAMLALENSCIILPVSSKVLYKDFKKKTLLNFLLTLKQYVHEGTTIPNDIIQYIMTTVHKTHKKD